MACNCNDKKQVSTKPTPQGMIKSSDQYKKMLVEYVGATGKHFLVGLASGKKYGRIKGGQVLWVLEEDYHAMPEAFKPTYVQPVKHLPKTPQELPTPPMQQKVATTKPVEAPKKQNTPITELEVDNRYILALEREGIETLEQLKDFIRVNGIENLTDIKGISEKGKDQIVTQLP